jgi:hypothetical protein
MEQRLELKQNSNPRKILVRMVTNLELSQVRTNNQRQRVNKAKQSKEQS